ncbi:hypothetical protein GCM10009527_089440 [Actinomadura nitritigenes]
MFIKTYRDRAYRFPVTLRHNGVVLAFAMDDRRHIRYVTLDPAAVAGGADDVTGWPENPRELGFATELARVGFGAADQTPIPAQGDDAFASSTARLTAAAPFQVLSDGRYVYVFRQAITDPSHDALRDAKAVLAAPQPEPAAAAAAREVVADHDNMVFADGPDGPVPLVDGRLLVDRFLLVGEELRPKRQVRFVRSRSATRPLSGTDSLGAADLDGRPFVEPTQELRFVSPLHAGRFAALLTPTTVAGSDRWQIFTHDAGADLIWSYSVERSSDGLFDAQGTFAYTCPDHPDVYSLTPGTCPCPISPGGPDQVCGQDLVPKVEMSGSAGTALSFAKDGAYVNLTGVPALGPTFSIEAWIKPVDAKGDRILLGGSAPPEQVGPSVWVTDGTRLRIGFGDGTAGHKSITGDVLTPGAWQHVAVTFDPDTALQVYVNGAPAHIDAGLRHVIPADTPVGTVGARAGGFTGLVDEVRFWCYARSAADLRSGMRLRLSGTEPGLVAYWRFDEGAGPLVWDQASGALSGKVSGTAWVTSDAPIGVGPGLGRWALRLDGRTVTGGLGAALYYQQEPVRAGYDATEPKPSKQAARVMFAAATSDGVAALDFAVGADGRLAEPAGVTTLADLGRPAGGTDSQPVLLDRIAAAEQIVARLDADIAVATARADDDQARLDAIRVVLDEGGAVPPTAPDLLQSLWAYVSNRDTLARLERMSGTDSGTLATYRTVVGQEVADLRARQAELTQALSGERALLASWQGARAAKAAELAADRELLRGDQTLVMPTIRLDRRGLGVSGALLAFTGAGDSPLLFDSALGRLSLYFRGPSGAFSTAAYDARTERARLILPTDTDPAGELPLLARTTDAALDGLTAAVTVEPGATLCTLAVTLPQDGDTIVETWPRLPREPAAFAAVLNGTTTSEYAGQAAKIDGKTAELVFAAGIRLSLQAGDLLGVGDQVVVSAGTAAAGDVHVAIEPAELHLPADSAVTRLDYDYSAATSTQPGADLSTGSRLVLADPSRAEGLVTAGTAVTAGATRSCAWTAITPGTALSFDGQNTVAGVLDNTAVLFSGDRQAWLVPATGDLDVTGDITIEAWVYPLASDGLRTIVGRGYTLDPQAEVTLRIANGSFQAGAYDGADHMVSVPMGPDAIGHWVHLAAVYDGAARAWSLYRDGILAGSLATGVGALHVDAGWSIGAAADGSDRYFSGAVDNVRLWNRARTAQEIAATMGTRLTGVEPGLVGYWYGYTGALRDQTPAARHGAPLGTPTSAASPPALTGTDGFAAPDDLTIETWVRPDRPGEVSRLVQYAPRIGTPDQSYALALLRDRPMNYDGTTAYVQIPLTDRLTGLTSITMEAWVRAGRTTGTGTILGHGPQRTPLNAQVALRIIDGKYQAGCWNGAADDKWASYDIPQSEAGHWVHLAGVYDADEHVWRLYRDGELLATQSSPVGPLDSAGPWSIGASINSSNTAEAFFQGDIDEVRIWNRARGPVEIAADRWRRLGLDEPGLLGCWRGPLQGGNARLPDVGPWHDHGIPYGPVVPATPTTESEPLAGYRAYVRAGTVTAETSRPFPDGAWTHLAASVRRAWAVELTGGYLDAGTATNLNLTRDLTIEVTATLADARAHGLISRGVAGGGRGHAVPYALALDSAGRLVFTFEDNTGAPHTYTSAARTLSGGVHRFAVSRKRVGDAPDGPRDDIAFAIDGERAGTASYRGPEPGTNPDPLTIGLVRRAGAADVTLRGVLLEVRLWSTSRDVTQPAAPITGDEVGLIGWWRTDRQDGNLVTDGRGGNDAVLRGSVSRVHSPDPAASGLVIYRDGQPEALIASADPLQRLTYSEGFYLGRDDPNTVRPDAFRGQLEELRIWHTARTRQQIRENMFRRLAGERDDLVAYYTFDAEPNARLADEGPLGNDLVVRSGTYPVSTAPVGDEVPQARDVLGGVTTSFNVTVDGRTGAAEYAALETDANGRRTGVFKRCHAYVRDGAWQLVTGFKVGDVVTEWVGQAQFDPQLVGYVEGAPPVPAENLTGGDDRTGASAVELTEATTTTYTYANTRDVGIDASLEASVSVVDDAQVLAGLMEIEAPLGIGVGEVELAPVEESHVSGSVSTSLETSASWLNDTKSGQGGTATRLSALELTGHAGTASFVPDNVGLALVQSQTADVFALRLAHTGALIAYEMRPNPDIPKDWNLITFPIAPQYTKQGTLDGKVGLTPDPDYPNALTYRPDASYFKPAEAYQIKARIQREQQELATLYDQYDAGPFATGTLPPQANRNLVNTYVWTAAGGHFAETQDVLDTYSESVGGSYSLRASVGDEVSADVEVFTVGVSLDVKASIGGHLELGVSKTRDSETAFGLAVTLPPGQDIGTVDAQGRWVRDPGKVDAYRFMTFYLSPQSEHHDLFFNQVVDPIWLDQSADPGAIALRQARQDGKRPACWRILHRVTYVSRVLPPLQDARTPVERALRDLDIDSNYELIKLMAPFVRGKTARYADFRAAVDATIDRYFPALADHRKEILDFLARYFDVTGA